ncbi:MAG: 4Fe-4S binding protein [Proteobacteria bacterium]|nr:4Fe-4S binding protein [Pseudomonadota bacterium]
MKIAITSMGPTLDDRVEARFGRCPYFVIIDTESMRFEAIENPNTALGGGAGIQSAQLMAEKDVRAILTGNCGPNAFQVFRAAGVEVIVGMSGLVRDVVDRFKRGEFSTTAEANVPSHFGMGASSPVSGQGMGGMGSGRGMGGGRGMGRGMGMGMGRMPEAGSPVHPPVSPEEDLESLRAQTRALEEQLKLIHDRIAGSTDPNFSPKLIAVVDLMKCTGCGLCVDPCPTRAITINEQAEILASRCNGCALCLAACPEDALSIRARR